MKNVVVFHKAIQKDDAAYIEGQELGITRANVKKVEPLYGRTRIYYMDGSMDEVFETFLEVLKKLNE